MSTFAPGLIFLSHASTDKDFVEQVLRRIPQSHLFYDILSINPGEATSDALDKALLTTTVFVVFVSPDTIGRPWVEYEESVARIEKIRRNHIRILVVPINGSTHKEAPQWMQKYMAVPEGYTYSDIARCIRFLYNDALRSQGFFTPEIFEGREALVNRIVVDVRSRSHESGTAVNFLVLSGIQQMGRYSVARACIQKIFPGGRTDFPVFDLPRYADAEDVFLALRQDIVGVGDPAWIERQRLAFPADPKGQADIITNNLRHFSGVNQTVIIKSAFGLRDQSKALKPWLAELFANLKAEPNIRVVWISERQLPPEIIQEHHKNVFQFHVPELDDDAVTLILAALLPAQDGVPVAIQRITPHIRGHAATAHHVAKLINDSQRSPESILEKPDAIISFQDHCLSSLLNEEAVGGVSRKIISLLKFLPSADYNLIKTVFSDYPAEYIADELGDLTDNCIITYSMNIGYKLPEMVRASSFGKNLELDPDRLMKLGEALKILVEQHETSLQTIEALIFVSVRQNGNLPAELKGVVTGSMLHDIVEQYYQEGHKFTGMWKESFRTAARLSMLADAIQMASDARETTMFNGADALIRIGDDPREIIDKMVNRKFMSVNYLLGSLQFHQKNDPAGAVPFLEVAFRARSYIKRTGRLLAKVYLELELPRKGLEVFQAMGDHRVNKDTGLLAQKIRCLRAVGDHKTANELLATLSSLDDEYGEYNILQAAKLMRSNQFEAALQAVREAEKKPKVNRINLKLLETAINAEKGDNSGLEDACRLAEAVGMEAGAASLRARWAIRNRKWRDAERELSKIKHKNYYDKLLQLRALNLKKDDPLIAGDPVDGKKASADYDAMLVELRGAGEYFDY